jgi:hypothetical protein
LRKPRAASRARRRPKDGGATRSAAQPVALGSHGRRRRQLAFSMGII